MSTSLIELPDSFVDNVLKLQQGYFTIKQASEYGLKESVINRFTKLNVFEDDGFGIFKTKVYPSADDYDFLVAGLISNGQSAISNVSALSFYNLTQEIPYKLDLTIDSKLKSSDFPEFLNIRVHDGFSDIPENQLVDHGGFFVTSLTRTIFDCLKNNLIQHDSMIDILESNELEINELTDHQKEELLDISTQISINI